MLRSEFRRPVTERLFDSRDTRYRAPYGAVAAGVSVHLRVCLPRWLDCRAARVLFEGDDFEPFDWGMFWCGMEGNDHEWWECDYTPASPGLYFYRFALDTAHGTRFLVRCPDGTARLADTGSEHWQLTCFDPDFETPDWMAGGIMYQIFPDRFATDDGKRENVPTDRVLRDDWGGTPEWRPDAAGKVRNNDYFGGSLRGIEQRLDHLHALGVTCLYLNPIFEAHSNHRYDTADYSRIDPLLGDEADFRALCRTAGMLGMRVMLDGVFSHTGADSRYFNRAGRYPEPGAYQSTDSPYYPWYNFRRWPDDYAAWWGFETLPEVTETNPSFMEYINGEHGIVRRWLAAGACGWRLDVADELPDGFLDALRAAAKAEKPDAVVLGEVWEDASNKYSYGHRRRYLLGQQLDSVMNYPFANAIYAFLRGESAEAFFTPVEDVLEHYPAQVTRVLMNSLGTHDTARALTVLAGEPAGRRGREWQAEQHLSPEQRARGIVLMKLAAALQYCLPGVPSIYYGDEAGVEGYRDPFNRGCYPWGHEDEELLRWYRHLGQLRRGAAVLRDGALFRIPAGDGVVAFVRAADESDTSDALLCAVNRDDHPAAVTLPARFGGATVAMGDGVIEGTTLHLPPLSCAIVTI